MGQRRGAFADVVVWRWCEVGGLRHVCYPCPVLKKNKNAKRAQRMSACPPHPRRLLAPALPPTLPSPPSCPPLPPVTPPLFLLLPSRIGRTPISFGHEREIQLLGIVLVKKVRENKFSQNGGERELLGDVGSLIGRPPCRVAGRWRGVTHCITLSCTQQAPPLLECLFGPRNAPRLHYRLLTLCAPGPALAHRVSRRGAQGH